MPNFQQKLDSINDDNREEELHDDICNRCQNMKEIFVVLTQKTNGPFYAE